MNQLQIIQHNGQRVLTTTQLAEAYGTDNKHINDNFQNNRKRYTLGKHFFELKDEELKSFKATTKISGNLKFAPVIYLWTEKGAWMHAKSLNTDK
ncbi:antirepressor, partial [Aneurinibacillus migulanus]